MNSIAKEDQITLIPVSKLLKSKLNPRVIVNDSSISELSESIKEVGLLQPVTVRKKKNSFEIVCGSRRVEASKLAKLKEVPCIVRTLTDSESLDLMITENLQRENISPLEEAKAFQSLLVNHSSSEISHRFGKSEKYIRSRIKLDELTTPFKDLLNSNKITLSLALIIAMQSHSSQDELYEYSFKSHEDDRWNSPTLKDLTSIISRNFSRKLSEVKFNLEDINLVPAAGSCSACKFNSSSDLILFPGEHQSGICRNTECFNQKTDAHFSNILNHTIETEPDILIGASSYLYEKEEEEVQEIINSGVAVRTISSSNGFSRVIEPTPPDRPNSDDFESEEDFQEALTDFNEEVDEFDKDLEEYQQTIKSDKLVKVLMVSGDDKGVVVLFQTNKNSSSPESDTSEEASKIEKYETKLERNAELEFEKIFLATQTLLAENDYKFHIDPITQKESEAFFFSIIIRGNYGKTVDINASDSVLAATPLVIDHVEGRIAFRAWLLQKLYTGSPVYERSKANLFMEIAVANYPEECKQIAQPISEAYAKRNAGIKLKIKALTPPVEKE
jgi:ParB family chromosome partitioning protein